MKMLINLLLIMLFPLFIYAQKKTTATTDKGVASKPTADKSSNSKATAAKPTLEDLQKQITTTLQNLKDFKKAVIDSVNASHAIKPDNVYGYLILKTTKVKFYNKDTLVLHKDYTKLDKKDKSKVVDDNAKYAYKLIDSVQIKIKQNSIVRIVIYVGNDITVDTTPLTFYKVNDPALKIGINSEDPKPASIQINDLLQFVPANDDDNVVSKVVTLSSAQNKAILTIH